MTVCPKCERLVIDTDNGCEHCALAAAPEVKRPEPAPAVEPSGLSRRDMIIAVAVIGVSGALTVGLLSSRGTGATTASAAAVAPARAPRVAEAPAGSSARWVESRETWIQADHRGRRKGFAFELEARNDTQVWMKKVRPLLVVRCADKQLEAFVFTDSAAAMEADTEDHTVRLAFDDQPERSERWPDSSTHDALFAPSGSAFVAELSHVRVLHFAYSPHNANPARAQFDVAGLQERLASVPDCSKVK